MNSDNTQYYNQAGLLEFMNLSHDANDLYLAHCGMQQCSPNHYYGKVSRPEYHLHFILSGKGIVHYAGKTHHLSRGQMFMIPPNTTNYFYRADYETPWLYAWVSFSGKNASYYMQQAGFSSSNIVRPCEISPEEFTFFIYKMLDIQQLTFASELQRTGLLFELISLLIQTKASSVSQKQYDYSSETYVKHALHYIHFHYNINNIQIQDIANYIGINRSYFSVIFKQETGMSPKEYLQRYRIDCAKRMLSTTPTPITDIATAVGFVDNSTFSKAFKQITGTSPRLYRSEHNHNYI